LGKNLEKLKKRRGEWSRLQDFFWAIILGEGDRSIGNPKALVKGWGLGKKNQS